MAIGCEIDVSKIMGFVVYINSFMLDGADKNKPQYSYTTILYVVTWTLLIVSVIIATFPKVFV